MLSMLPLRFAVVPVSCSFIKSLFSPHSLQRLFRNSIISIFAPQPLKMYKFFVKISIFVTENHVYTKPLTPNTCLLPSNVHSVSE